MSDTCPLSDVILQIFPPSLRLVFNRSEVFNLDKVQLSIFFFQTYVLSNAFAIGVIF